MRIIHRIITIILILLFVVFALVQYNDPDPWLWMGAYLFAAFMGFAVLHLNVPLSVYLAAGVLFALAAFFQWPEQWEGIGDKMLNEHTERAREALGLLICAAALLYFALLAKTRGKTNVQTNN